MLRRWIFFAFLGSCGIEREDRTDPKGACLEVVAEEHHENPVSKDSAWQFGRTPQKWEEPVEGFAQVYHRNTYGDLVEIGLPLIGNGHLENALILTSVSRGERMISSDHQYFIDPDEHGFEELSMFAYAVDAVEWYRVKTGMVFDESLTVVLDNPAGSSNNAMYQPKNVQRMAQIVVGRGTSGILQNLRTDADVMFHEFSHHVLYQHLKSTSDQGLLLHEGLADFLTMLKNDDPCVGRSICPEGSLSCWMVGQCLRSGDSDVNLRDDTELKVHLRSQALSGMLWQLYQRSDLGEDQMVQLALTAVVGLGPKPTIADFVEELFEADQSLWQGKHEMLIDELSFARLGH